MKKERLDKVLSHHGFGSRKDCKKLLHTENVKVNGVICTAPETLIDLDVDFVSVDDEILEIKKDIYIMMNKCQGVVTSTKDAIHRTVIDLLPDEYKINFLGGKIHPIGRLDIDAEGLLLLTTDGRLTHKLTSPKNNISKTYYVRLKNGVGLKDQKMLSEKFLQGIDIASEGIEPAFRAKNAMLVWPSEGDGIYLTEQGVVATEVLISISEGKYHEVKRMFASIGNEVVYLKRISIAGLFLDSGLSPGEYRPLVADEIELLQHLD